MAKRLARRTLDGVVKPWPGTLCCVLEQETLPSQCPSPYKWVPPEGTLGVILRWTRIPSRVKGGVEVHPVASCVETRISSLVRTTWPNADVTFNTS